MSLSPDELTEYHRRHAGLAEGETYDPALHFDVPALAFGPEVPEIDAKAAPLDPGRDLAKAAR